MAGVQRRQAARSTILDRRLADATRTPSLDPSRVEPEQATEAAMMETLARRYDRPTIRIGNDGPPDEVGG
jgi:hypothetical protein